ncbi:sulfite exporter TauE/SafE family protein 5-like [Populus alba x Populus x berolinensis]|uniref:Sulfite exporter TauE/SafE family protein 5-like n=1 Tax=Populus alba x Populus x berolinensis TaxID=444605 RepID=A0AAD6Q5P9_9ROSI|nr:sulfite exporter TauE/SafE family protein 5-like [Populus alba x Populus x berolinensis]
MKANTILTWLAVSLAILIALSQSRAEETQPFSNNLKIDLFLDKIGKWSTHHQIQPQETGLKLAPSMVIAGVFCFIAASISSAGGIGGGGLYIPILTIVASLDLKTASSFSAFMVTGGSVANVMCNMFTRSAKFGGQTLVDYDIAILSEPCMLLGVSVGVICNLVFPEWLVTILFAVFLACSTFKTCQNGVFHWKLESEEVNRNESGNLENGLVENQTSTKESEEVISSVKEPLLGVELTNSVLRFPWMKLGILFIIWFSFSILYLLRGNRYGEALSFGVLFICDSLEYMQGIIPMESCGFGYWVVSSLQIPLAIIFTALILYRKESCQHQTINQQGMEDLTGGGTSNKLIFPVMALLAGMLGGVFGIGGGMLISPLLLQVGIAPEITAATCSFMVFFSSSMSALQYLLLGMEHVDTAIILSVICFVASLLGLLVVQRAIVKYGRASMIVFSVSTVMALSTVLMTSFGALNVWRDYNSGRNMGFKLPC